LQPVTVERTARDVSVIQKGIQAGETVVTDGQFRLVPGARVMIKPSLGSTATPVPAAENTR
jgi:multidrug efflux system membrane fusion protein